MEYQFFHLDSAKALDAVSKKDKPCFAILFTHAVLAVVIVPLVLMTLNRALHERFALHKKIARWTWPLWMYVSVTGVVVYQILYQVFPQRQRLG